MDITEVARQGVTVEGLLRGLMILGIGVAAGFALSFVARFFMRLRGRGQSSRRILARLLFWVVAFAAFLVASAVAFPSINPVDVLGGLGVISIAAGIAFQTILSNFFAGIVILARDQYRVGDQIKIGDTAGTVMGIFLSSTSIRTFDGRLVIVPNNIMHSNKVVVQTGYEYIRSQAQVDIDADNDLDQAKAAAIKAMSNLDVVLNEPAPRAMFTDIGARAVTLDLLFWSGSTRLESRSATDAVIRAVLAEFEREGITVSAPTLDGILAEAAAKLEAQGMNLSDEGDAELNRGPVGFLRPKKPAKAAEKPSPRAQRQNSNGSPNGVRTRQLRASQTTQTPAAQRARRGSESSSDS